MECCGVEAVVSIDERGQMVLPKGVREKAGIKAGDKFAVVTWERKGEVCCLLLIKASMLAGMVREMMSPFLKNMEAEVDVRDEK